MSLLRLRSSACGDAEQAIRAALSLLQASLLGHWMNRKSLMKRQTSPLLFFDRLTANRAGRSLVSASGLPAIAIAILVIACTPPASAVNTVWNGSSAGGDFNATENWTLGVPGATSAADLAIFNSTTNVDGTVSFSADASHATLQVLNTAGTLSFDMGSYQWTMTGSTTIAAAGTTDAPKVRVVGGKVQSDRILLGNATNNGPLLELSGSTAQWHTVFTSGGAQIGLGGDGSSVLIYNGAKFTGGGQAIIGLVGSRDGSLTVSGAGSTLDFANYVGVGHSANATSGRTAMNNKFEVLDGGYAEAGMIYMAITVGSTDNLARVSGPGSILNLIGTTATDDGRESRIGMVGANNELRIENGGTITGTNTFLIGRETTSTGSMLVIDNGSLTGTGIEVRRGSLSVTNGRVDLTEWFDESDETYKGGGVVVPLASGAGSVAFNSGTINSVNASVTNGSALTVGDGGAAAAIYFMQTDHAGNAGTHTFGNGLALASNGVLAGSGNIVGNVSGAAGSSVEVGASPGLMNVTGDWDNTNMSLYLEIDDLLASTIPGVGFDQIAVSGTFTHGGTVTIDVSELVTPLSAQQLRLIGWGSEIGLSGGTTVSFVGGPSLAYSFQADGLYVSIVPEPAALLLGMLAFMLAGSTSRNRFGAKR